MDDMDDIDEDRILEGLSVEELKQLQNEIEMIADDRKKLADTRTNYVSHNAVTEGMLFAVSQLTKAVFFTHFCNNMNEKII